MVELLSTKASHDPGLQLGWFQSALIRLQHRYLFCAAETFSRAVLSAWKLVLEVAICKPIQPEDSKTKDEAQNQHADYFSPNKLRHRCVHILPNYQLWLALNFLAFDLAIRLILKVFYKVDLVLLWILHDVQWACKLILVDLLFTLWPLCLQLELLLLLTTDISIFWNPQ